MSTYTFANKHKVTHKWVIKDFKDCLSSYEDQPEDYCLCSSKFSLNKTDKIQFQLELIFNKIDSDVGGWLSLYFKWCNIEKPILIKCNLYLLNVNEVKYNTLTHTFKSREAEDYIWEKFYEKKQLLDKEKELLPNNTLTIGCDVVVHNEHVSISSVYERSFKSLIEDQFNDLLESENDSDFTFKVDDQEIKVHKLILKARSPVFKAMFESEMKEKGTNITTIENIRPVIFKMMIGFIYTDKIQQNSLTKDDAMELLAAADKYQLENLKDICGELLHKLIDFKNAMEILSLAEQHNMMSLIASVKDFIKVNKQEVLSTIDLQYFDNNGHHAKIFLF